MGSSRPGMKEALLLQLQLLACHLLHVPGVHALGSTYHQLYRPSLMSTPGMAEFELGERDPSHTSQLVFLDELTDDSSTEDLWSSSSSPSTRAARGTGPH